MPSRLLRVPWIARRSNQSILKEINPEYSLEGLIPKPQYFGHLMRRANSLEKTLILGKIEGRRRRGRQYETVGWHHWLNEQKFEQALEDGEGQGSLACCNTWSRTELGRTERLNNWIRTLTFTLWKGELQVWHLFIFKSRQPPTKQRKTEKTELKYDGYTSLNPSYSWSCHCPE